MSSPNKSVPSQTIHLRWFVNPRKKKYTDQKFGEALEKTERFNMRQAHI